MRGSVRPRVSVVRFAGLAACLAVLTAAAPAEARRETIRWTYSQPGRVNGFRIHVGTSPGSYSQVLEVGKPNHDGQGVYTRTIEVADATTVYVAISAYAANQQSPLSNVSIRAGIVQTPPPPSNPPPAQPPPSPPPPSTPPPSNPPPANPPPATPPPSSPPQANGPPRHVDSRIQLRERFSGYEEGASPEGFVDGALGGRATDTLFSVRKLKRNKVLAADASGNEIHSHYVTDGSAGWSRYEFKGRLRLEDEGGAIGVTVLSQLPDRDAYYRVGRSAEGGSSFFHIAARPEGQTPVCNLNAAGVTPAPSRWYKFRVQVYADEVGTRLRAKVWRRASSQPEAWQIDCYDTSAGRLESGVPGLWSSGPGIKMWDDLRVKPLRHAPKPIDQRMRPSKPILGQ